MCSRTSSAFSARAIANQSAGSGINALGVGNAVDDHQVAGGRGLSQLAGRGIVVGGPPLPGDLDRRKLEQDQPLRLPGAFEYYRRRATRDEAPAELLDADG